ncbi:DUF4399 domain-containing protein [Streptacidiphilus sp. EB129]|uniref:DUF4399 domain-containing protein n=1 Tax=Streptacidiphilus sp. EB129 TaxID=3156262 RepID=UPI0035165D46
MFTLLINTDPIPAGQVIPIDAQHLHYGKTQTETDVTLPSGQYQLTLQFADGPTGPTGPTWPRQSTCRSTRHRSRRWDALSLPRRTGHVRQAGAAGRPGRVRRCRAGSPPGAARVEGTRLGCRRWGPAVRCVRLRGRRDLRKGGSSGRVADSAPGCQPRLRSQAGRSRAGRSAVRRSGGPSRQRTVPLPQAAAWRARTRRGAVFSVQSIRKQVASATTWSSCCRAASSAASRRAWRHG